MSHLERALQSLAGLSAYKGNHPEDAFKATVELMNEWFVLWISDPGRTGHGKVLDMAMQFHDLVILWHKSLPSTLLKESFATINELVDSGAKVLTLEPNQHSSLVLAYVQVVEVLESLGMVSDALKYLDVAHDLSEKFTNAVITGTMMTIQAKLLQRQKKYGELEVFISRASDPDDASILELARIAYNTACTLLERKANKDYQVTKGLFDATLVILERYTNQKDGVWKTRKSKAHRGIAMLYAECGESIMAIEHLDCAALLNSQDAITIYSKCEALIALERYDDFQQVFESLLENLDDSNNSENMALTLCKKLECEKPELYKDTCTRVLNKFNGSLRVQVELYYDMTENLTNIDNEMLTFTNEICRAFAQLGPRILDDVEQVRHMYSKFSHAMWRNFGRLYRLHDFENSIAIGKIAVDFFASLNEIENCEKARYGLYLGYLETHQTDAIEHAIEMKHLVETSPIPDVQYIFVRYFIQTGEDKKASRLLEQMVRSGTFDETNSGWLGDFSEDAIAMDSPCLIDRTLELFLNMERDIHLKLQVIQLCISTEISKENKDKSKIMRIYEYALQCIRHRDFNQSNEDNTLQFLGSTSYNFLLKCVAEKEYTLSRFFAELAGSFLGYLQDSVENQNQKSVILTLLIVATVEEIWSSIRQDSSNDFITIRPLAEYVLEKVANFEALSSSIQIEPESSRMVYFSKFQAFMFLGSHDLVGLILKADKVIGWRPEMYSFLASLCLQPPFSLFKESAAALDVQISKTAIGESIDWELVLGLYIRRCAISESPEKFHLVLTSLEETLYGKCTKEQLPSQLCQWFIARSWNTGVNFARTGDFSRAVQWMDSSIRLHEIMLGDAMVGRLDTMRKTYAIAASRVKLLKNPSDQ